MSNNVNTQVSNNLNTQVSNKIIPKVSNNLCVLIDDTDTSSYQTLIFKYLLLQLLATIYTSTANTTTYYYYYNYVSDCCSDSPLALAMAWWKDRVPFETRSTSLENVSPILFMIIKHLLYNPKYLTRAPLLHTHFVSVQK